MGGSRCEDGRPRPRLVLFRRRDDGCLRNRSLFSKFPPASEPASKSKTSYERVHRPDDKQASRLRRDHFRQAPTLPTADPTDGTGKRPALWGLPAGRRGDRRRAVVGRRNENQDPALGFPNQLDTAAASGSTGRAQTQLGSRGPQGSGVTRHRPGWAGGLRGCGHRTGRARPCPRSSGHSGAHAGPRAGGVGGRAGSRARGPCPPIPRSCVWVTRQRAEPHKLGGAVSRGFRVSALRKGSQSPRSSYHVTGVSGCGAGPPCRVGAEAEAPADTT